jgi:hypothetical protein
LAPNASPTAFFLISFTPRIHWLGYLSFNRFF